MWKVSHCEIGGDDLNDLKSQLNIRDLQDIGESQADHQKKSQKATTKRQVLQNQYFVGLFYYLLATLTATKRSLTDKK